MPAQARQVIGFHLVRYGTPADQEYLLNEFLDTYDGLVINANMVAHMPAALASFVAQRAKKPYFIDPQTHAFQHDIGLLQSDSQSAQDGVRLRRPFAKMIDTYGDPVTKALAGHSILPQDFASQAKSRAFCERVIGFQISALPIEFKSNDTAKYYDYLKTKGKLSFDGPSPSLLVAPYFCMTPNTYRDWLDVNIRCAQYSKEYINDLPLGVQIVISRDLMTDKNAMRQVITRYKTTDANVFLIWIDAFSEHEASSTELNAFVTLLNDLSARAPVINLYGGYFSVALRHCGAAHNLIGVVHGLEYAEVRGVVPVGGGLPVSKFYLPALHERLPFRDAFRAARELGGMETPHAFHDRVCGCSECRRLITGDPKSDFRKYGITKPVSFIRRNQPITMEYPTSETRAHCVRHYMWCKQKEYTERRRPDRILQDLTKSYDQFKRVLGLNTVAHCKAWKEVLSPSKKRL